MIPEFVEVQKVRQETGDTISLYLQKPHFSFAPGQFNMLYAFGVGEVPISIADYEGDVIVHTVRAVGSVSESLVRSEVGDRIGLRGPFGSAWPSPKEKNVLLVAGGIGLAPLKPTIEHLFRQREAFASVHLVYGTRSPEDIIFSDELNRWQEKITVYQTVDVASPDWKGDVGNVIGVIPRVKTDWANTDVYVCGPEVMMRFTCQELREHGVDPAKIYLSFERNMKCAIGHCGRCQLGPKFMCKDGPVFSFANIDALWNIREL